MQKASPGSQGVPQLGHTFAAGAAAGMGSGAGSVTDAGAGATTVSMASASTTGSDATASSGSGTGAASGEATSSTGSGTGVTAGSGSDAATAAGAGAAARLYPQLMQKTSPALTGSTALGQAAAPDTGASRGSRSLLLGGKRRRDLCHGLAAAAAEQVGRHDMRAAEGTHIVGVRGRGSGRLRLEALDLRLALGALGVARGDAVIERLAAGAQVGVVLVTSYRLAPNWAASACLRLSASLIWALSFIVEVARPVAAMPRFTED